MPSLFSRSRTQSSPSKGLSLDTSSHQASANSDEFGRVSSRTSNYGQTLPPSAAKKDKRKDRDRERPKTRAISTTEYESQADLFPGLPDGAFLPLNLDRPRNEAGIEQPKNHDYGFLSYERHVVLGIDQVARLVEVVAEEIGTRGLMTPFIFSTTALDISSSPIKRLISAFLSTCAPFGSRSQDAERRWQEEARFAGPHELGMCLRWGLARVVRYVGGQDVRGLLSWELYHEFRDSEAALNYPSAHFATLLTDLPPALVIILLTTLTLLTRLTAHSSSSGHTPPTLSPLFGPLIFGLGPATLAFHHTYVHYLRATNAMEHLILAFIRWQDTPRTAAAPSHNTAYGSAASLGVPTRLKEWIRGYPSMLPFLKEKNKNEKPQARRGARTIRVVSVRRNVRMYSPDLVKTAASWAQRSKLGVQSNDRGLTGSKEWERVTPSTLKLAPRYSEAFKKRMDMPSNYHPDTGVASSPIMAAPSMSSSISSQSSTLLGDDKDYFGLGNGLMGNREGEDKFRSLTDLKWGEFEEMGFGGLGTDEKKLQFDLTEGARNARAIKRTTLTWNDFSSSGFSRTDAPLNDTLQFSTPLTHTISSWPTHSAEISKKLKKTQRSLPPFGWDTEPVMGAEEMIEEAFVDVFCDLIYGGGWMDLERGEETDRDCNWALIEFKSMPVARMTTTTAGSDPRTATSVFLFEEFVPWEYRQQLSASSTGRRRLPSLFSSSSKSKQWKQAPTLNGRPYVVGHVPQLTNFRELEFEGLLQASSPTKVISLATQRRSAVAPSTIGPRTTIATHPSDGPGTPRPSGGDTPAFTTPIKKVQSNEDRPELTSPSAKRLSRFRLPGGIPVPSPGGSRKTGLAPSEYSTVDFETRLASYSDDENGSGGEGSGRRRSKDDAWVDILVGQNKRVVSQETGFRKAGIWSDDIKGISDPDLASQEVAQALAAVRALPSTTDDEGDDNEAIHDTDTIDEVESVPRASVVDEYDRSYLDEEQEPEADSLISYRKKSLGYFDLHPERRPGRMADDDDPRARLQADSDEETDDEDIYGPAEITRAQVLPLQTTRYQTDSTAEDIHTHSPITPGYSQIYIPEFEDEEARRAELENNCSKTDSVLLPVDASPSISSKVGAPSKTAALIEMYREKERRGGPTSAVQSSRLPVRSGSVPKEPAGPTTLPVALPKIISSLPPPQAPASSPGSIPDLNDAAGTPTEEPGRYKHGAPLHNVLEEEEEEV